jgi:hypothetical protein
MELMIRLAKSTHKTFECSRILLEIEIQIAVCCFQNSLYFHFENHIISFLVLLLLSQNLKLPGSASSIGCANSLCTLTYNSQHLDLSFSHIHHILVDQQALEPTWNTP